MCLCGEKKEVRGHHTSQVNLKVASKVSEINNMQESILLKLFFTLVTSSFYSSRYFYYVAL